MHRLAVLCGALALVALIGCNTSERGGKKDTNTKGSETFRLKGPATSTTLKQGETRKVDLTVDRGKDFKRDVTLKADAPTGLKAEFDHKTVKASDTEKDTMTITAAKNAPVGDHTIKVTATPSEGNAVDIEVKVKVEKGS
jgi:uncharacterized membrane protein